MGGLSLASPTAVLLLLLLPLAYGNSTPPWECTPPGLATQTGAPRACMATITMARLCMDMENVKRRPTMVMATLWLPTIPPTMPSDMECIITDMARGLQHITSHETGRDQSREGTRTRTVPGIITTVEGAKRLEMPSTSAKPGIVRWCNTSSSKYLAMCGGGSTSANKQIE